MNTEQQTNGSVCITFGLWDTKLLNRGKITQHHAQCVLANEGKF